VPLSSIWLEIGILTDFEVLINGEMDLKLHLYSLTLIWVKSSPMEKYSPVGLGVEVSDPNEGQGDQQQL
jgi:hypothetical protein